ncbi:hypothetical protein, partial [Enterococcus faecalis]
MERIIEHYRHIMVYHFKKGRNATQTAQKTC